MQPHIVHTLDLSLSVLRCVAVCCSVLPCGAVCCSALQCVVWVTYIQTGSAKSIKRNFQKRICYFCRARFHKKPDDSSSLHIGAPYMCMCEYTHTHTHTYCTWITESDVSPGVGTRHIEPEESRWTKSQDKSIRVSQSIYVCTKYICIHICQAMGWDLGPVAFFLETCDSSEMPRRKMWTWYRELKSTWIWAT